MKTHYCIKIFKLIFLDFGCGRPCDQKWSPYNSSRFVDKRVIWLEAGFSSFLLEGALPACHGINLPTQQVLNKNE